MPRHMSFALTERQLMDGSKTVTRRMGWRTLTAGDEVIAVRKAMGLRKGERVHRLARLHIISVRRDPLMVITSGDCRREGFPDMTPDEFIAFFCRTHAGCTAETIVARIEFEIVERLA